MFNSTHNFRTSFFALNPISFKAIWNETDLTAILVSNMVGIIFLIIVLNVSVGFSQNVAGPGSNVVIARANGSRQAPFCVDDTNTDGYQVELERFEEIFQFHYNNSYIPVASGQISPSGLITKVQGFDF